MEADADQVAVALPTARDCPAEAERGRDGCVCLARRPATGRRTRRCGRAGGETNAGGPLTARGGGRDVAVASGSRSTRPMATAPMAKQMKTPPAQPGEELRADGRPRGALP